MHCDPLVNEGLFPIDDTGRTERDLPFEYNPNVDYFAMFDPILPAWQLIPYQQEKGSSAAFSDLRGAPEIRVGPRVTRVLSYRRYVRAIDPAGNLCQLIVSTVRPSPHYKDGFDKCGTYQRVIVAKSQRGWIIVERDERCWSLYAGRRGNEYAAWAWAVMQHRRAQHAAAEKAAAEVFKSKSQRATEEAAKEQQSLIRGMGAELAKTFHELSTQRANAPKPAAAQPPPSK